MNSIGKVFFLTLQASGLYLKALANSRSRVKPAENAAFLAKSRCF